MPIPEDLKHLFHIEDVVNNHGGTIIGAIRTGKVERDDYWELTYIICWYLPHNDTYITHQANVNSAGSAALFHGHYDQTEVDAMHDMIERANLSVGRI
jgi:hypothetical protein